MMAPSLASAQMWTPGPEIVEQSMQVSTNGTVNTVYFNQGSAARILTLLGTTVPGRWTAANQQLCLDIGTGRPSAGHTVRPFRLARM